MSRTIVVCADCGRTKTVHGRGLCKTCHQRNSNQKTLHKYPPKADRRAQHVVTEVEFLAGTDSRENLAKRLGYASGDGLHHFLKRHNRLDLWEAMAA